MKLVIFGATGMVGASTLREALAASEVESVLSIGRLPTGIVHPKLRELLITDLFDFAAIENELHGIHACIWAIGISSAGLDETAYARVTEELTLTWARRLLQLNPCMSFCYCSAGGAGGPGMWARVRRRVEDALRAMPFEHVGVVRPGFIRPGPGIRSKTPAYQFGVVLLKPLFLFTPLLVRAAPFLFTTSEILGRAMIRVVEGRAKQFVLESADINRIGQDASALPGSRPESPPSSYRVITMAQELTSKVILVTGASDGIGKFTATALAKQGHRLIIHGRNRQKTEAALAEIKRESGNPNVEMILGDFLSLAGVKAFADTIKEKHDHLDVLINNAGAQFTEQREVTSEGHEKTMVINVFAPMLLTKLLLPLLAKSKSARVVTVSSDGHRMTGQPDLNDIELKQGYNMAKAYGLSKLYEIWVMNHFIGETKKADIHNVTFNCVHPASTQSSLGREAGKSWKWKIIYFLWQVMMIPIDKAASSSLYAATSSELEGVSGKYFGPKGEEQPSAKYYSPENERKVWDYALSVIQPYLPTVA